MTPISTSMSGRHSKPRQLRSRELIFSLALIVFSAAAIWVGLFDGDPRIVGISLTVLLVAALILAARPQPDYQLELRAGLVLESLSDAGFVVLHDLWLEDRCLDYVLVGPPGIFAIRTEPASSRIIRPDSRERKISDVLAELDQDVACIDALVKATVKPLLVTAKDLDVQVPAAKTLLSVARLEEVLRAEPSRLDAPTVRDTLTRLLRATSGPPPDEANETEEGMNFA